MTQTSCLEFTSQQAIYCVIQVLLLVVVDVGVVFVLKMLPKAPNTTEVE